jgi:hypothetical protein
MQRAEQRRRGSKLSGAEWKQRRRRRPRPRGFPRVRRAPRHACNVAGQLLFCLANVSVKVSRARHRAAIWRRPGKGAPKGDGCARGGRSSGLGARGSRGSGGGGTHGRMTGGGYTDATPASPRFVALDRSVKSVLPRGAIVTCVPDERTLVHEAPRG